MKNAYWNSNGNHQEIADKLARLIPASGSVDCPRTSNKELERLRVAMNCYYDLYNNGLWNNARSFSKVFGVKLSEHKLDSRSRNYSWCAPFKKPFYEIIEQKMDAFILAAAEEQGIK